MALRQAQEPRMLRRGLPRVAGGEPWPPALSVELTVAEPVEASGTHQTTSRGRTTLRRGLPRVTGGEPWPPPDAVADTPGGTAEALAQEQRHSTPSASPSLDDQGSAQAAAAARAAVAERPSEEAASTSGRTSSAAVERSDGVSVRRGLPRTPGAEPWPPDGTVAAAPVEQRSAPANAPSPGLRDRATGQAPPQMQAPALDEQMPAPGSAQAPYDEQEAGAAASVAVVATDLSVPLPFQRTVFPGRYATARPAPKAEPERIGPFTKGQWAGAVIVGGGALLVAAAMAVFFVRWLLSTPPLQDFLQTYPGEYHLPEGAPVGFPAWLGWQHFFNFFLMVLIIRSGLRIRTEKRPTAFWTPRNNPKGKVSLTIWFHQALDILWLVNGVVFVVLLFATGQWMRVIPTSWEVFPNALSATLQYVSLEWPTENGWVNYNSLQQLTYFATIFLAAPLAAITGYRMSGMWPKKAERLNKAYPIDWARAVHFPVMLYFVVFIFIHVALVLATGALRNLNHMYAAQGSVDGVEYATNWTGFWLFVASLVVVAAAWVAARPLTLAPIAKLFGTVSAR